ncbi:BglG family transcription antiterminator [Neobacillus notoginsengisoli]|nr:BglG family transcription antiterminator [Neobacillus notoginsengisoli]
MITSRQQNILSQLIQEEDFLQIDLLVDKYELSPRTVRNDLLIIEEWLKQYDAELERDRKLGYRILLDPIQKERIEKSLRRRPDYLDSRTRVHLILKMVLAKTKVRTNDLLQEFQISRNTLLLDLMDVRIWLEEKGLECVRQNGWIHIKGDERLIRKAYLDLLKTEVTDEKVLQFILEREEAPLANQLWNSWFQTEDAHFLLGVVRQLEKELSIEFTDSGFSAFVLHLLMAMERLKNNHFLRMEDFLLKELQASSEFRALEVVIVGQIEEYFGVHIPKEEIAYMTQHLLGTQKKQLISTNGSFYWRLAKEIVNDVEEELGHLLVGSDRIIQNLAIHLESAIHRVKFGLQTKNPLLKELKSEFGSFLDMMQLIVNQVMKPHRLEFGPDEIGYIVLHVGSGMMSQRISRRKRVAIVCSSGVGTSSILRKRMETLFPDCEIAGIYSYQELKEMTKFDIDAVLSMIEIGFKLPVPWIKVSPLLPLADQAHVSNLLGVTSARRHVEAELIQTANHIVKITEQHASIGNRNQLLQDILSFLQGRPGITYEQPLTNLLPLQSISLQLPETNWESAIRYGNRLLRERGLTGPQYEDKMVQMIQSQKHHFIIQDGVAFPHASVVDGVWKTGFSLLTFREPIPFGPGQEPIWLIITLAAIDKTQHVQALSTLLDVFNDDSFMNMLRKTKNAEEVWNFIRLKEQQL